MATGLGAQINLGGQFLTMGNSDRYINRRISNFIRLEVLPLTKLKDGVVITGDMKTGAISPMKQFLITGVAATTSVGTVDRLCSTWLGYS